MVVSTALTRLRSTLGVLPALLVVGVAVWETCATHVDASAVPTDEAWDRASQLVRAKLRPGDLIVFAPDWIDPVGRLHLGDLMTIDDAARMDAARYGRIWELSIRGAHAADTAGLTPASTVDADGVSVELFERTPVTVLADVRTLLSGASTDGGSAKLELAEVGFAPHRCLQSTPAPGGAVRITFPALPLGAQLVGYVGLADVFTRRDIRAPGTLEVDIAHRKVAIVHPGVDDGWVRFEIKTQPGSADVTFIASADAAQRQICFAAEARQ